MELLISIFPFLLIMGVMYFVMIRPQQKAAKEAQAMLESLAVGDSVVTIGGLHGVIDELKDAQKAIVLDCEGIYLTFERRSVARVVTKAANAFVSEQAETETTPED